jgi:hypothetical protein
MEGRAPASLLDRGRLLAVADSALHDYQPFNSVTKYSQIILDKVVVLDKGSASVNTPLPLHGNRHQLISIHIQPL